MQWIETLTLFINRILMIVGGVLLVAMVALTCANIVLRATWLPVRGTFELMGYAGAVVTAFALGHTQITRGHIAVDVLINLFPAWLRTLLNITNNLLCLAFFSLIAWQICRKATILMQTGEVSETLQIIFYPFAFAVALGCAALALVCFSDLLKALLPPDKEST